MSAYTKPTAVVSGAQLLAARSDFEQFIALLLLVISFLSAAVACNGPTWPPNPFAVVGGLVLQGFLTFLQWMYNPARDKVPWYMFWLFRWQYLVSIVLGAGTTIAALSIVLLLPLAQLINQIEQLQAPGPLSLPYSVLAAWGILIALGVLIETAPEQILVG